MSLQARFPKLFRHLEGAEQALGFPEVQAKLNAATPRLKTFLVPKRQCYPVTGRKKGEGMQKCPSTLISIGQGYKNFPSKTQRAQQRQVQPEAWLAGSRAVPPCYGPEELTQPQHVGPIREDGWGNYSFTTGFLTSLLHTAVKCQT